MGTSWRSAAQHPSPRTAGHSCPPPPHSCLLSGHRWSPGTADQLAAEEGSSAPQRPGPVSAVGREGPGAQAVLLRGQPSVTVLRFLAQQDTFLLFVNLGIHTRRWPAVHSSPRRHPQRASGGSHRSTWLALPSQRPGPASRSHWSIQGLALNTQAGQELTPRGRPLSGARCERVPPRAAAAR